MKAGSTGPPVQLTPLSPTVPSLSGLLHDFTSPSRSKWRLIDIIAINYIIYTHNFYTNGKPRIASFQTYAACKDPSSYS